MMVERGERSDINYDKLEKIGHFHPATSINK